MEITQLTRRQLLRIYFTSYQHDFPRSERKPLPMLLRSIRSGLMQCYGLFEDGHLRAYAILLKQLNADQPVGCLLDYLATLRGHRSQGCGSVFLGLLRTQLSDVDCLLAEVEDPDCAENADVRALRQRRIRFYERNGFVDTGLRADLFHTNFRLIELRLDAATDAPHAPDTLRSIYLSIYRSFLPEQLYQEMVHIS